MQVCLYDCIQLYPYVCILSRGKNKKSLPAAGILAFFFFKREAYYKKMSNRDVQSIKRDLFKGKHKKSNRGRLRELKGRK